MGRLPCRRLCLVVCAVLALFAAADTLQPQVRALVSIDEANSRMSRAGVGSLAERAAACGGGLKTPLLVVGARNAGAGSLFHLLRQTGLFASPPHEVGGASHAFRRAGLAPFAAAAVRVGGGANYSLASLPAYLAADLRLRACQFLQAPGVTAAAAQGARVGRPWSWFSLDTAHLLPVFAELLPPPRLLLVTRRGASAAWAAQHAQLLAWCAAALEPARMLHVRIEDLAATGRPVDERVAAMASLLSWLGWQAPAGESQARAYPLRLLAALAAQEDGHGEGSPVTEAAAVLTQLGYGPPPQKPVGSATLALDLQLRPAALAGRVAAIASGQVRRTELEVVLCRYEEDFSWAADLAPVLTVYNLGSPLGARELPRGAQEVVLPNFGRENAAYLRHVVDNYNCLAALTVFSHAGPPVGGLRTSNGGGHMLQGTSFYDFLTDGVFLFSTAMSLTSHRRLRASTVDAGGAVPRVPRFDQEVSFKAPSSCFDAASASLMGPAPLFSQHVRHRCRVEGLAKCSLADFWDEHLGVPRPEGDVVFFAQGARFSVTREQIRRRPLAHYEALLATVNASMDPANGYFLEALWYYVMTTPARQPCEVPRSLSQ